MVKYEVEGIVKVAGRELFGRVLEIFAEKTKIMTVEGEKTFFHNMLEPVAAPDLKTLVVHPEQLLFREYCARYELSNPLAAKYFRLLAEDLLALTGWYPEDRTWRFINTSRVASNLAIRVPGGYTSNIFHLSCCKNTIRVEIESTKDCPPGYEKYFPRKGVYFGGHRKVIAGGELNDEYILEYLRALKAVYAHNLALQKALDA